MNDYYDLNSNRIFVQFKDLRTIQSTEDEIVFKYIDFSSVTKKIYLINQYGIIINSITNIIQQPIVDNNGFPCVALSSIEYVNDKQCFSVIRYRIVDLVAYSFIKNSDVYLERGCIASNKNGILSDNYYTNIEYQT